MNATCPIRLEVRREKRCLVKDTGRMNTIFMLTLITERLIQRQKCLYLYFVD